MNNPDVSFKAFQEICAEFKVFCETHGTISEADTRIKLIDRILKETLNWPEAYISREDHTNGANVGYSDYRLTIKQNPYIVVEAKREGESFSLPTFSGRRHLKLNGILKTSKEVMVAINQVRQYCVDDMIINYAVATNGYSWIIFKTTHKKSSWKESSAVVYYSIEDMRDNFLEFWNLLSFDAIIQGSLEKAFSEITTTERKYVRVVNNIINADVPLEKNRLHAQLYPIIDTFFDDIADKDQVEILKSCYVYSRSVTSATADLNNVIKDAIPLFLKKQGTRDIITGEKDSGIFDEEIKKSVESNTGQLYLLLAGIGAGKTTFLKRYLKITGKPVLEKDGLAFYISLLGPPTESEKLEQVVYTKLLEEIRSKYADVIQEKRRTLKKIYEKELNLLHETTLKAENLRQDEYEKRISPYLDKLTENTIDYVTRLLKECQRRGYAVLIFIDNVDQLPPEYQAKVFLLSQKVTREIGSSTVLSLREESYHSASTQKILTAYANKKFHIASPRFRRLIDNRLNYATRILMKSEEEIKYFLRSGIELDRKSIIEFLSIIQKSIFLRSKQIAPFIEAICHGNMRLALDMFNTFLVSGATDVDKMLHIFNETGAYQVAFHEFLKSVMLKEKRYYKETPENPIMNVFECSTKKNSSHFTTLRILRLLESFKDVSSPEGRGYVELDKIMYEFENCFDNGEDFIDTADRMVRWRLIEVNTKSIETVGGATYLRVTPAGLYYLKYLVKKFPYLDLVLQDTPINDDVVVLKLTDYMRLVDNLSGKVEDKHNRMKVRFERVDFFLNYLKREEETEFVSISIPVNPILNYRFSDILIEEFEKDKTWILNRFVENLEKYEGGVAGEKEDETIEIPGLFEMYDEDGEDDVDKKRILDEQKQIE